jgi:hypothetical protein
MSIKINRLEEGHNSYPVRECCPCHFIFVCILLYHSLNNNQLLPVMFALNISRNRPSCQTISNAFWASVSAIKMDLLFSIYKKGGKPADNPNSYRKITVTNPIGKLIEKLHLCRNTQNICKTQSALQNGFTGGQSPFVLFRICFFGQHKS